jgi:hypothetical protein
MKVSTVFFLKVRISRQHKEVVPYVSDGARHSTITIARCTLNLSASIYIIYGELMDTLCDCSDFGISRLITLHERNKYI